MLLNPLPQYLLPALQSRPGSVGMPDSEFERLLLDVQVGRVSDIPNLVDSRLIRWGA
jgi:hypothetical protein